MLPLRSVVVRGLTAAMSLTLAAIFMPEGASAQGMALPYESSVTKTGAARYSIPITPSPGRRASRRLWR